VIALDTNVLVYAHRPEFPLHRRAHGVTELWSADRDYLRFPSLRVRNPLDG
jgi:predicted nucleic acid-binding protein